MNNISSRLTRAQLDAEMPLRQYFLFVGGALLALLFVVNWLVPASNERTDSAVNFPPIRIHSERKGPEAVVIDTSKSTIEPTLAASGDMVAPQVVTPHKSPLDEAFTDPDTLSPQQADANEQNKTHQGQLQTNRKVMDARLERRPALSHRADPAHVEPVPTTFVHSSPDFRETFAQLVPRPLKQAGRGETNARRHMRGFNQDW
jgi:hypothetical protein